MGLKIALILFGLMIIAAIGTGAYYLVKRVSPQSINSLPVVGRKTEVTLATPTPSESEDIQNSPSPSPDFTPSPSPEVEITPTPIPQVQASVTASSTVPTTTKGGAVVSSAKSTKTVAKTSSSPVSMNMATVTYLTLNSSPAFYNGRCPVEVTFWGTITVSGPGNVSYKFVRSDGSESALHSLSFSYVSSVSVSDTWSRNGGSGWEKLVITSPNSFTTPPTNFNIGCN